MKDIVVGVFNNYDWDQVKHWAESLRNTGYDGKAIAIAYNVTDAVYDKLYELNFTIIRKNIFGSNEGFNIVVQRFYDVWDVCKDYVNDDTRIITTDVGDVIFQSNPSKWLDKHIRKGDETIIASGEGLQYKDEPWSKRNMISNFGNDEYDKLKDKEICCAGVIAGSSDTIVRLCQDIWLTCQSKSQFSHGGGGPDQSAYNVLINGQYLGNTIVFGHNDNWACEVGTTLKAVKAGSGDIGHMYKLSKDKERAYKEIANTMIWTEPNFIDDKIYNYKGKLFSIIHQYNRVPELLQKIKGIPVVQDLETIYYNTGK